MSIVTNVLWESPVLIIVGDFSLSQEGKKGRALGPVCKKHVRYLNDSTQSAKGTVYICGEKSCQ